MGVQGRKDIKGKWREANACLIGFEERMDACDYLSRE